MYNAFTEFWKDSLNYRLRCEVNILFNNEFVLTIFQKKHGYKSVHSESNPKNHINESKLKLEKPVLPFKYDSYSDGGGR